MIRLYRTNLKDERDRQKCVRIMERQRNESNWRTSLFFLSNHRSHVSGRSRRQFLRVSVESVDPIRQRRRRSPTNVRRSDRRHRSTHDQDVAGQAALRVRSEIRQARAQNGSSGVLRRWVTKETSFFHSFARAMKCRREIKRNQRFFFIS